MKKWMSLVGVGVAAVAVAAVAGSFPVAVFGAVFVVAAEIVSPSAPDAGAHEPYASDAG